MRTSLVALAAATALACSRGHGIPAEPDAARGPASGEAGTASGGDTLRVAFGRAGTHGGSGVRATFLTLVSDSRCPTDALCVWEGDAVVRLRLEHGDARSDTTLHWRTRPDPGLHAVDIGEWRVTFFGLTPAPTSATPRPDSSAYVAWLLVRPARP